ncbi:coenzyme F430 synthase [Methanospirillum sp.]|uniref:coenzyme F430 synthase n=1 Tax=Methanospirillum sp. TaxID=45200 RepID=UPI0035A1A248
MRILVLDSIHGGKVIADHLSAHGHETDLIDVYRHAEGISPKMAKSRTYDLITAPVHLDPDFTLLREIKVPVISHHAIVRWLLNNIISDPVIEITGKQGKTTTAAALAYLMTGPGLLHSSAGVVRYQSGEVLGKYSITPASLLTLSKEYLTEGWLISEVSLGFCGIGTLGILTSFLDYPIANGKKSALVMKTEQAHLVKTVLVPPGEKLTHDGCIDVSDLVLVSGKTACYQYGEISGTFTNPLLLLPGYKTPLMLAAGAALLLGIDPAGLSGFSALPGRMEVSGESGYTIVDNSNSGTCLHTTLDAFRYGKKITGDKSVTLIIGQESASVCENFSTQEIISSISGINPQDVILITGDERIMKEEIIQYCKDAGISSILAFSSSEGIQKAKNLKNPLILLSVKRWK